MLEVAPARSARHDGEEEEEEEEGGGE
jgi:hypothetical protein